MTPTSLEQLTIYGYQLINIHNINHMLIRLVIDLIFTLIIIRWVFYPIYKERDYVFTTILVNLSVFFICFLLASIKLQIGFAFGLFAVFSIIRYRTQQIPIREMTYIFVVIIIAVINAISNEKISYAELLLANTVVLIAIYILEHNFLHGREVVRFIVYEKIDLVKPENYEKLIKDLKERTGLDIQRAEIDSINFLNDTAKLKITYKYPELAEINKDK